MKKGSKHSKAALVRMKTTHQNVSPETRAKITTKTGAMKKKPGRKIGSIPWNKGKKTGKPSWNTGLKTPDATRLKQSLAKKGKPGHPGSHKPLTAEHKLKISLALKEKPKAPFSLQHCKNIALGKIGKKQSAESNAKRSKAHKGKPKGPFSDQHRKNLSLAHLGVPLSEAHCRALAVALVGHRALSGELHPHYGKPRPEVTLRRIGRANKIVKSGLVYNRDKINALPAHTELAPGSNEIITEIEDLL